MLKSTVMFIFKLRWTKQGNTHTHTRISIHVQTHSDVKSQKSKIIFNNINDRI